MSLEKTKLHMDVKVDYITEDLSSVISKYSHNFSKVRPVIGNSQQSVLYIEKPERYLIIAVKIIVEPQLLQLLQGYNFQIGFAAENKDLVNKVMNDFRKVTKLQLRDAPEIQRNMMEFSMPILWEAVTRVGEKKVRRFSEAKNAPMN